MASGTLREGLPASKERHGTMEPLLDKLFDNLREVLALNHPGFQGEEIIVLGRGVRRRVRWSIPDCMPKPQRASSPECTHSPDFRTVKFRGKQYIFTQTQAAVVAKLFEAWEDGLPGVSQVELLQAAGSESKRLRDVFRDSEGEMHPAVDVMIVSAGKGIYTIAD